MDTDKPTHSAFDWDIDFDAWARLASSDPHDFEKQRAELVSQVLERSPTDRQPRLRRLQWRIDKVRETSGTPLAACIRISNMMWDSVMGKGGLRESLQTLSQLHSVSAHTPEPKPKAKVLPFRAPTTTV